jgi:hypothetical protein
MSINPGTQNIENLGNSAETLRPIFRALDLKMFTHDSIGKTRLFKQARVSVSLTCPRTTQIPRSFRRFHPLQPTLTTPQQKYTRLPAAPPPLIPQPYALPRCLCDLSVPCG